MGICRTESGAIDWPATWRALHQPLGMLSLLTMLVGLLVSRAALSIGMMVLVGNALINQDLPANTRRFWAWRPLPVLTLLFWTYLLTWPWSANQADFLERVRMKLPFLLLPWAVLSIPRFDRAVYFRFLHYFFWLMVGAALAGLLVALPDLEATIEAYKQGHLLPTPIHHIRYSLLVVIAMAGGWHLYSQPPAAQGGYHRGGILAGLLFLFLYLHVLAVRSGLLGLYLWMGYLALRALMRSRNWKMAALLMILAGGTAWAAYTFVPTLQNKIGYSLWSLEQFRKGEDITHLSDPRRLATLQAGWEIGRAHPWLGVGIGDIRDATDEFLRAHYPTLTGMELMPHNQYLLVFAACGLAGLFLFLFATFFPLCWKHAGQDPMFVSIHLVLFSSFLVEHTIESQLGAALYAVFVITGLRHQLDQNPKP